MMRCGKQRGSAAVEFAIVLPLLVVLVFGMVEFSLIMYDLAIITNASRVGARYGALFQPTRPACSAIQSNIGTLNLITFSSTPTTPTITCPALCVNQGDPVTVNVSYTYRYLFYPIVPKLLTGSSATTALTRILTASTTMRCE